jgi:anti-sigma28 factor (negative regulator of flagellin synthesis)
MTIRGLDPSGELGRLFFQIQSKDIHAQEEKASRTIPPHSSTDAVDLSLLATEIRDYSSRASQLPELREDKIQRIQNALEGGGHLASSEQVAEALTRETILNALGS